jgi:hypothetical protein
VATAEVFHLSGSTWTGEGTERQLTGIEEPDSGQTSMLLKTDDWACPMDQNVRMKLRFYSVDLAGNWAADPAVVYPLTVLVQNSETGGTPSYNILKIGGKWTPSASADCNRIMMTESPVRIENLPTNAGRYWMMFILIQDSTGNRQVIWGSLDGGGNDASTYRGWPANDQIPGGNGQRVAVWFRLITQENLWWCVGWRAITDNLGLSS